MIGVWNRWFVGITEPELIGDETTYRLGAEWLIDCEMIEDWGAGKGGLRKFVHESRYRGIDGSVTPFADITADLTTYRSRAPGIFIRHVLEHNYGWRKILDNACISATERLFIAVFTPPVTREAGVTEIAFNHELQVPDLAFPLSAITIPMRDWGFKVQTATMPTQTQYGVETVFQGVRT